MLSPERYYLRLEAVGAALTIVVPSESGVRVVRLS
jgi:hypothetical protein